MSLNILIMWMVYTFRDLFETMITTLTREYLKTQYLTFLSPKLIQRKRSISRTNCYASTRRAMSNLTKTAKWRKYFGEWTAFEMAVIHAMKDYISNLWIQKEILHLTSVFTGWQTGIIIITIQCNTNRDFLTSRLLCLEEIHYFRNNCKVTKSIPLKSTYESGILVW